VDIAEKVAAFYAASQNQTSQRAFTEEIQVPRSTLQDWLAKRDSIDADEEVIQFFENPVGVAFLHRIVVASHVVTGLLGASGVRFVCAFLELSGLAPFVATSFGAQQRVRVVLEKATVEFGKEEGQRLGQQMTPKEIAICEDETFHPQPCLVAIDPVSNFILLESYASDRKAETWSSHLKEAIAGLPVRIVQSTSDEGKGILRHVREDLGIHHSPDVFHVQRDCYKATSGPLARSRRQAEEALQKASKAICQQQAQREEDRSARSEAASSCPVVFNPGTDTTVKEQIEARERCEAARALEERAKKAIQSISTVYHPYDLEAGAPKTATDLEAALEKSFLEIEEVATQAGLKEGCLKRIQKARRVLPAMVATLSFYWTTVTAKVKALSLPPEVEAAVFSILIPGLYLKAAAKKATTSDRKRMLLEKASELLSMLFLGTHGGPLCCLKGEQLALVLQVAKECAELFQRASSCVEGRNGRLSLQHHGFHHLNDRKLGALTVVHNYFIKRHDGTTAAERFFGAKPKDLFEFLLANVDLPGRPAKKRSQTKSEADRMPLPV
jgi:hypothetical protein